MTIEIKSTNDLDKILSKLEELDKSVRDLKKKLEEKEEEKLEETRAEYYQKSE